MGAIIPTGATVSFTLPLFVQVPRLDGKGVQSFQGYKAWALPALGVPTAAK